MSDGRGVIKRITETTDTLNEEARAELEAKGFGATENTRVEIEAIAIIPRD